MIHLGNIPQELKAEKRWVVWRYEKRDDKRTKIPYVAGPGRRARADSTNSKTWRSFKQAREAYQAGEYDGIGFMLGNGWAGVDLDDCIDADGNVADDAAQIINTLDSYAEVSPSGQGVKIFIQGTLPEGRRRTGNVEMYDSGRYFTVTGEHLEETPTSVESRTAALKLVHVTLFPPKAAPTDATRKPTQPTNLDDSELLQKARDASNGAKFNALWAGNTNGYQSDSEADLALCSLLAFWTGPDPDRINRLFKLSGLCRDKWDKRHAADGRSYGEITIDKVLAGKSDFYDPDYFNTSDIGNDIPTGAYIDTWLKRAESIALNKEAKLTIVDDDGAVVGVENWHAVSRRTDRRILYEIHKIAKERNRTTLALSCYTLAERANVDYKTAWRSLERVTMAGILSLKRESGPYRAPIYALFLDDKAENKLKTGTYPPCVQQHVPVFNLSATADEFAYFARIRTDEDADGEPIKRDDDPDGGLGPSAQFLIADLLAHGDSCIGDIAARTGMSRQTVSKHAGNLAEFGIVDVARDGRSKIVSLLHDTMESVLAAFDAYRERLRTFGRNLRRRLSYAVRKIERYESYLADSDLKVDKKSVKRSLKRLQGAVKVLNQAVKTIKPEFGFFKFSRKPKDAPGGEKWKFRGDGHGWLHASMSENWPALLKRSGGNVGEARELARHLHGIRRSEHDRYWDEILERAEVAV